MNRGWLLPLFACATFAGAGCASHVTQPANGEATATAAAPATPLPTVAALASPAAPPAWIVELSPRGKAAVGAQIRIRFAQDVVPLEAIEAPDRQAALAKVDIAPKLPGHFIFVTPRMLVFSAEAPVPLASRIVVTLRAGFADLEGHVLANDVAYEFTTQHAALVLDSETSDFPVQGARPRTVVTSTVALDQTSLTDHASLVARDGSTIPLQIVPTASPSPGATATPEASSSFDEAPSATYVLAAARDVPLASSYIVRITPGVKPARGNLAANQGATGKLRTYGPLRFSGVTTSQADASRPLVSGSPSLAFTNALDVKSAYAAISLTPAAKQGYTLLAADDDSNVVAINAAALAPNTAYTIHIADTLKDRFGQTLANAATAQFTTGALAPNLWAPSGYSIFPSTTSVALNVATANLPNDAYRERVHVLRPIDTVTTDLRDSDAIDKLLAADADWPTKSAPKTPNVETTRPVPLDTLLGNATGTLAYGVAADYRLPGTDPTHTHLSGAVALTNVGVFAQYFPSGGFVRAHQLSDGAPIANARVEVYAVDPKASDASAPCVRDRTDATGTATFTAAQFATCLSGAAQDDEAPTFVAIVYDGADWSFARSTRYGQSLGDSYATWSAGKPHALGSFVSDRSLYQRGETAYFTGLGYFETAGVIQRGRSKAYTVTIRSPHGKTIALGARAIDEFGAFNVHAKLATDAELGDYAIAATGDAGEAFAGTFTVAQFKPPNFRVALALSKTTAAAGDTVVATTTSTYLFGAPVAGGSEHVAVTRSKSNFSPKGYEAYAYGPQWEYPQEPPSLDGDVSETDITTSSTGLTTVPIPVATDLPYPVDYRVDGETKDVSNLAVSDSQTFTAFPGNDLIVVRGDYLATENHTYPFDFAVVDPNGTRTSGRAVHFTLARRVYDRATQLVEGSETAQTAVHYEKVSEFDATSSGDIQHLQTMPTSGGEYRLRANLAGSTNDATATDFSFYVIGNDANWYGSDDTTLRVKLDKPTYHVGETATAFVASPYKNAELLFAIVRNDAIERKIVAAPGASIRVPFTITADMLPNVVVEAVLVRRGAPLHGAVPTSLTDLSREGFATVHVALDSKYVRVTATPQTAQVGPGATQEVKFHVADAQGRPVRAELTVAVANDAILQLSGYRFPDLVTQIYADLPISTRYADNRTDVKLATAARFVEKGFGYGGGVLAGLPGTRVRTNFQPIAFFDGAVRTDAAGNATISFAVPGDLTTWRVLAFAATRDMRFGKTDATFIATKPVVTNPILPQFARPGDILEGGVSVTDVAALQPGADGSHVGITATLAGPLAFASPAARQLSQSLAFAGPTAGYRFAMRAGSMQNVTSQSPMPAQAATPSATTDATVQFATTLGGFNDAFSVHLPIVTSDVLESAVETGTTQTTVRQSLAIAPQLPNDAGGLTITLASTLLGDTLEPLDTALKRTSWSFGFVDAARIAIASDRMLLERQYGQSADIPALQHTIAADRASLRPLARADGSYAFFPGGPSDPFTTAFVAIQLVQARAAGIDVTSDLASIGANLRSVLADPTRSEPACKSAECLAETRLEALETLGAMGDVRSDHLSDIYALRDSFSYYERVELARQLIRVPDWRDRGIALRDKLLEQLNESGRFAGVVEGGDFGETPVDGQSQLLGLMIETHVAGDRIDRTFRSLLGMRGRDGTWGCACDDAEAMNAVVLYAKQDDVPPNFIGSATLGGLAFAQRFEKYAVTTATKTYPMSSLLRGNDVVSLARDGTGTLHYTIDFEYAVRGSVAGTYQGIRIDRIMRPAGATGAPVASFGLALPTGPITIAAGNVFDIEDRVTTDHPLEGLVVTDSLAAGLEAIDARFQTNSSRVFESLEDWNIDYQTIERNQVTTYARNVQPGVYAFHYLVRSVTPGTYSWPAAHAALALAPDEFGRTAAGTLVIK